MQHVGFDKNSICICFPFLRPKDRNLFQTSGLDRLFSASSHCQEEAAENQADEAKSVKLGAFVDWLIGGFF